MKDPRIEQLAEIIVDYSTRVKKGDLVWIQFTGPAPLPLVTALHGLCLKRGAAHVEVRCGFPEIQRSFYDNASDAQIDFFPRHDLNLMKKADVFIAIRGDENARTLTSVPPDRLVRRSKVMKPITDWRVKHTRWVVLIYPTPAMAQDAGMSLAEFEDFIFDACLIDWKKMDKHMAKLERRLTEAEEIHLRASDTDIRFSKKGIAAVRCAGHCNMPDGEVYTAPSRTSAEGYIQYNTPSPYQGREYNNVRLAFKKGRIVDARCDGDQAGLDAIFDTDPGARYLGEFAIGVNQGIRSPIKEILFDEKIGGSIHLTPGQCYDECSNGNKSAVHWDLVKILNGDGELYFDGKLIQKDGKFVPKDLQPLNT